MKKTNKLAFTLIELLVVITIIWILATGATSIYTSQIQKARDATRMQDIDALKWAIEQAYQDQQEYPITKWDDFRDSVKDYLDKFPEDPKFLKPWNKTWDTTKAPSLWYVYNVWADDNWIENSIYEISTAFEANWNITWKAKKDKWDDDNRLENWIKVSTLNTTMKVSQTTCNTANTDESKALVIHSDSDKLCAAESY